MPTARITSRAASPARSSFAEPPPDAPEVIRLVRAAVERRAALAAAAFPVRLFDGAADGVSRLVVERFGAALRVAGGPERVGLLPAVREALGEPRELFFRFGHGCVGGPDAGARVVSEHGLAFEVALLPHRHTGLFLEARVARGWVKAHAAGRRVLNLFAYTCAFGAAAAAGGARATTNVDEAPGALARGKRNYAHNALPFDGRSFWCSDVLAALESARRSGAAFDGIVLHPPPVATGGSGRRTEVVRDLEVLAAGCRAVLAPGGWLLLAWTPPAGADDELHRAVGLGPPSLALPAGEDFRATAGQPGLRAFVYAAPA